MNDLKKQIFDMYKCKINEEYCKKCKNNEKKTKGELVGPFSMFHIGKNLANEENPIRIVFVGKTSWHEKKDVAGFAGNGSVLDASGFGREAIFEKPEEYPTAFWKYIRYFVSNESSLNLSLDDIAITNLCKCNIFNKKEKDLSKNITPDFYFKRCFSIFEEEIKIIKPTHLILFVGAGYDHLLRNAKFGYDNFRDEKNEDCKVEVPKKDGEKRKVWWWHRIFMKNGKVKMQMLRTRHPQRAPFGLKEEIVKWIKSNQID